MNIQLIHGQFNENETLDLITQMIHVKIKFHESKIKTDSTEEDIKNRESRIRLLQKELFELKKSLTTGKKICHIESVISID